MSINKWQTREIIFRRKSYSKVVSNDGLKNDGYLLQDPSLVPVLERFKPMTLKLWETRAFIESRRVFVPQTQISTQLPEWPQLPVMYPHSFLVFRDLVSLSCRAKGTTILGSNTQRLLLDHFVVFHELMWKKKKKDPGLLWIEGGARKLLKLSDWILEAEYGRLGRFLGKNKSFL